MIASAWFLAAVCAAEEAPGEGALFHPPVRLMGGEAFVRVERPGYASPCWGDVTGDGEPDLLVGQFAGGKIRVYEHLGDGELGEGQWLRAEGEIAEVPGVW